MKGKKTISAVVASSYSVYSSILSGEKHLPDGRLVLDEEDSHPECRRKTVDVILKGQLEPLSLVARGNLTFAQKYSLALFDPSYMQQACCRFDSYGKPHTNFNSGKPLKESRVRTPHFHCFDETGVEIAYRNAYIDAHESEIFTDRGKGFKCFLDEEHVVCGNGVCEIKNDGLFQPEEKEEDILKGVSFDE